jgi:transcriptional regulator with XRE-family HTH domain
MTIDPIHGTRREEQEMPEADGGEFREWLRARMRARRISQRYLAQLSGVHASGISRLLRNATVPNLATALRLAHGLGELHPDGDVPGYLRVHATAGADPVMRVERALCLDAELTGFEVRQVLDCYRAVRAGAPGPSPAAAARLRQVTGAVREAGA